MKYIKNNLGYAVSFKVEEKTYEFDCERIYRDTWRIATDGITEVSEEDLEKLNGCEVFVKYLNKGKLSYTSARPEDSALSKAEEENRVLREKLAKMEASEKALEAKVSEAEAEAKNLKDKLNSMGKKTSSKAKAAEEK